MGRQQVRCHGDERRFEIVADFVAETYGKSVDYIADVAGGQGLLARLLNKKYNYHAEVVDPRGHTLTGVAGRACPYTADMAGYYDLVIGLHPDEAVRPVVESALRRPMLVVPCCNHWDSSQKLGAKELVASICRWLEEQGVKYETVVFNFDGPKNVGIWTRGQAFSFR